MTTTCPQCGNVLEIPFGYVGRRIRCGNCNNVFAAEPDEAGLPDDDGDQYLAESGFRVERYADTSDDAPVRKSNVGVWGMAILLVILLCPCMIVGAVRFSVVAFPKFETYTDAMGRFEVGLPGQPTVVERRNDDGVMVRGLIFEREQPSEQFFAYTMELPAAWNLLDDEEILNRVAERLQADHVKGHEEIRREFTKHDGYEAMDVEYEHEIGPIGSIVIRTLIMPTPLGKRGYLAGFIGPGSVDDARVQEFFLRFRPIPPDEENLKKP